MPRPRLTLSIAAELAARIRVAAGMLKNEESWAWGIVSGAISAAVAYFLLPIGAAVLIGILGLGAGILGHIDAKTKLILNGHTLVYGAIIALALVVLQFMDGGVSLLAVAAATGTGTFLTMLVLWWTTGFASGGDIKLAPVIAAGLSVVSPMTAPLWLLVAFILCLLVTAVQLVRRRRAAAQTVPMAPLMAAAIPTSIALNYWLYAALDLGLTGV
jgi:prepilin signal peptidase PulO-like enzyme (type II secretory pathway)